MRIADMFEGMLRGAIEVFRSGDRHRAADISRTERIMDRLGAAIRRYLADIGNEQPLDDEDEGARGQEILSAVINLDTPAISSPTICSSSQRGALGAPAALPQRSSMRSPRCTPSSSQVSRLGLTVFLRGDAALCDARRLVVRKRLMRRQRRRRRL